MTGVSSAQAGVGFLGDEPVRCWICGAPNYSCATYFPKGHAMPDDKTSTTSDEPIPTQRAVPDPDDLAVADYEYESPSGVTLTAQLTKSQAEALGARPVKAAGSSTKARSSSNK